MSISRLSILLILGYAQILYAAGDKVGTFNGILSFGGNAFSGPKPIQDAYDIGYNFQGGLGYTFSPNLTLYPILVSVEQFAASESSVDDFSVLSFTPFTMFSLDNEQNVNPHLIFGGGLYRTDAGDTDMNFGMFYGVGSEFALGSTVSLLSQFCFHYIYNDNSTRYADFNFGIIKYIGTY